jgi:hypothetical protein
MNYDQNKVDEMVLALLMLTMHQVGSDSAGPMLRAGLIKPVTDET